MTRMILTVLALGLLLPAAAAAEAVPGTLAATDAALALAPDGTPRVAFVAVGRLQLATRATAGSWSTSAVVLPGPAPLVDGLRLSGGRTFALVQDAGGGWLALEELTAAGVWRAHVLVRNVQRGSSLGFAGLAVDAVGRPVVAYALRRPSRQTFLRLVRPDARGRYVTRAVTRAGFPPSDSVPAAAPVVLPDGSVRVLETSDGAAIEWAAAGRTWSGQLLYASALGVAAGPAATLAADGGVYSAWTELFPGFDQSQLLLTLDRDGEQTTILHTHAFLVALAQGPNGPEAAANDYVDGSQLDAPGGADYAGILVGAASAPLELDGRLLGYAVEPGGGRQLLLAGDDGIDWYRAPALAPVQVSLAAAPHDGAVALSGSVAGGAGGGVELYREQPGRPRELVATAPLAPDGSFAASDAAPAFPCLYRAVYRDAGDGVPYASLLRAPLRG